MRKNSHEEQKNMKSGRIAQKMKTRKKLLLAANALMVRGETVGLEEVAKEAGVSLATTYRYFSNKEILKREAFLEKKSEEKKDLFSGLDKDDLAGRVNTLIRYHFDILTQNETEFRLFLSAAMQESVENRENYSRAGRRVLLIEEALLPIKERIAQEQFNHMIGAISVILGIESITVLKDLYGVENDGVLKIWRWMINKIITGH